MLGTAVPVGASAGPACSLTALVPGSTVDRRVAVGVVPGRKVATAVDAEADLETAVSVVSGAAANCAVGVTTGDGSPNNLWSPSGSGGSAGSEKKPLGSAVPDATWPGAGVGATYIQVTSVRVRGNNTETSPAVSRTAKQQNVMTIPRR